MTLADRVDEGITERQWQLAIVLSSAVVLVLTLYFLIEGISTVFMHLYYFPIILLAYHYREKGVLYSAGLSALYLLMVFYFDYADSIEIISAFLRVIAFIGVAVVVAFLSTGLQKKQLEYQSVSEFNSYIISNANVWLTVLDGTGKIFVWNKAAEEISGYSASEVVGKNTIWRMLYPDRDYRRTVTATITRIIGEEKVFQNFDTTIRTRDGEKKSISWNTRAFPDDHGVLDRYVAIGIDITERKLAEERNTAEQELATSVAEGKPLDRILSLGLDLALTLADMDSGGVYIADPGTHELELVCSTGISEEFARRVGSIGLDTEKGNVVLRGEPVYSQFGTGDLARGEAEERERLRAIAIIPISRNREVIACLILGSHTRDAVPERRRGPVEIIASYLGNLIIRVRAEEALRESEKRYRTLFERAADCIYIFEAEGKDRGRIVDANMAAAKMHGYTREELLRMKITDLDVEESQASAPERFARALKGEWLTGEVMHRRKDGSVFPMEINGGLLDLGTKRYIVAIDRDITERKQAEKVLAESEERFRGVAERSSDVIILADMTRNATYVSPSVTRILGYRPEEVVDRPPEDFVLPEDLARVMEIHRKIARGLQGETEVRFRKKDGSYAFLGITASPIIKDGEVAGVQLIGRDVTETKQVDLERKEAIDRITRNMEQFAVLNDQIRNPLSAILGYASLEEGPVFEKIVSLCYEINNIITRLDQGYIESEKVRDFLRKHYEIAVNGD
ncbi:PAS domain S-box-containing protein [Methanolinea mesophila]|uniref:PAS domain S-box protein n=1 Tax=Methanolinea mesophila TaxID=547055 RepID=UPI001AE39D79|nr:PAS domain S-box protein [Methanolinea mesophila]MBP1929989.1 PAS domain S-box-containing protein [Methanolinea mesophila]